ncbi:hypothetical protein Tco_1216147 [Tanacetum coccineum]
MDIQLQISKVFKRVPGKHPGIAKKNLKPNQKVELNWKRQIQRHAKGKAKLGNFDSSKGVVLCARSLMQQDMAKAKKQSISIMIELEKIFPPAFFDIMIHVAIHLPDDAILGGLFATGANYASMKAPMKKLRYYDDVETDLIVWQEMTTGMPEEEPDKVHVFPVGLKSTADYLGYIGNHIDNVENEFSRGGLITETDAEQRRPTIKKLEVKQVEFKLGEDCWEIQVKRSKFCHEKIKVLLNEKVKVLPVKDRSTAVDIGTIKFKRLF